MNWNGKHYYSLDHYLKNTFGHKLYKLALDGGMTCPNRDSTLGYNGCIFCGEFGSGDFAAPKNTTIHKQIEAAKHLVSKKINSGSYIAYYQSYTNTYAPHNYLESLFYETINHPDIAILSIATRPDCLPSSTLDLLSELNKIKPIWIELGLQTIHKESSDFIRRGYELSCFEEAYSQLKSRNLTVIVHAIIGLPRETPAMILETIDYLGHLGIDGIKLQLLHILKGTDLEQYYYNTRFHVLTLDEYIDLIIQCIEHLPTNTVIHRISGDGPKSLLIAPLWSSNKRLVYKFHRKSIPS